MMPENSIEVSVTTLADLTPREREILQALLSGKTNRAIAGAFGISERTVDFHLDNIYAKTGRRTRLTAGIWAIQHGLRADPVEIPG